MILLKLTQSHTDQQEVYVGRQPLVQVILTVFLGVVISPATEAQLFGNGADGDVVVSGTTALTSDLNANNLTITATGVLETNGYTVYVAGTLVNDGIITDSQSGGNGGTGGSGGAGGTGYDSHFPPTSGSPGNRGCSSFGGAGNGGQGGRGGGGGRRLGCC